MFFFQFPSPNNPLKDKIKININNDTYLVKLSLCLENSPIIKNSYESSINKSEISLDISNEDHQFKIIAKLFNGKKIYFNSYNIEFIEYASNNLKITNLYDAVLRYKKYISLTESDNILFKLSEINSILFNLNERNIDAAISSKLFDNLFKEEIFIITNIIFNLCSIYIQKASVLFDFLAKLNMENEYYAESFIFHCDTKAFDSNIRRFIVYNLYNRKIISEEQFKNQKSIISDLFDYQIREQYFDQDVAEKTLSYLKLSEDFENIKEGMNTSELATSIRNDDVDLLQQISTEDNFNFNQKIPMNHYEFSTTLLDTNLLQYSAAFGSVKCFKFLLINGADSDVDLIKYAILGGSNEILRICEQKKCNFDSSLFDSINFHRETIFDWLLENKFQVESSTDICSYAFHGRDYIYQQWFQCYQCKLVGNLGLCYVCSKKCHKNHNGMEYSKMANCFCDCGDLGNCCCLPEDDSDSSSDEEETESEENNTNNSTTSNNENDYSSDYNSDDDGITIDENNKYDIKNLYRNIDNIEDEEEEDEEYKNKKEEDNQNENEDKNKNKNENDNQNSNKIKKKLKKKKKNFLISKNSKKYVSSNELVIECYKKMNFVCLRKLINIGVDIIRSIDPPLLVEATKNKDLLFVKFLLSFPEIDVNNTDTIVAYKNPLLIACEKEYNEIFDVLIQHPDIDVNITDSSEDTPLSIAVSHNNIHMVEELLKNPKILVNKPNTHQETPIFLSCINGSHEIFEMLFKRKDIDIDACQNDFYRNRTESIFLAACLSGSIDIVKELIEYKLKNDEKVSKSEESKDENKNDDKEENNENTISFSNKNSNIIKMFKEKDFQGNNALHLACRSGNVDLIQLILDTKLFNINESNLRQITPLRYACISHNIEAFKLIIHQEGIDLTCYSIYKQTPLHYGCSNKYYELVEYILDEKLYDVNSVDYDNKTPLHYACGNPEEKIIERLLKEPNIDVNICDRNGNTPFHIAAESYSKEVIELLLNDSRVLRNPVNKKGETPIIRFLIFSYKCNDCFKLFVDDDKVDIHAKDKSHKSVLFYAAGYSAEAVSLIIDKCKDEINEKTTELNTPLHNACMREDLEIVKLLLKVPGIKVNEVNIEGLTPYDIADDPEIKSLIQNFGK